MSFFELNVAMTGLFAAKRGLQVTSNNIMNVNTQGYSRQVLKQQASTPLSGIGVGMTGTGVTTLGINRVRDSFIDRKLWDQNAKAGEYNVKVTQNSMIESAFGEPSDTGFTAVFNDLFTGISDLSTNPSSAANKVALKEQMNSFTKYYNNISSTLKNYQQNLNFEIKTTVNEINGLATRIQSLNSQIMDAEIHGDEASSFRDERDNCIDRLSEIMDIEVRETEYDAGGSIISKMTITAGGQTLVDHLNCHTLGIKVREDKLNPQDVTGLYDVVWQNGLSFDMADANGSGELKGLIDSRDGCGTGSANAYNGIPYYISRLDSYVQQFARTMNDEYSKTSDGYIEIQSYSDATLGIVDAAYIKKDSMSGEITFYDKDKKPIAAIHKEKGEEVYQLTTYGADGSKGEREITQAEYEAATQGYASKYALFTYTTGDSSGQPVAMSALDYSKMTADNFSIAKEIYEDPAGMRTLYDESNPSDANFMLNLLSQKDNKKMFREGDPKDYMTAIFAELGINAKEAQMYQGTQEAVINNLKNQRLSVSQVDVTEEFTYLIQYQQAYQAAAKMMNTMDGIYETTIFKLGNF